MDTNYKTQDKGLGKLPEFQETNRRSKIKSRDFVSVKKGKKWSKNPT